MKDNEKVRTLIDIPADGNYIEILGHRIDGFESFEAFLEHLKKYVVLEETVKIQNAKIAAYKHYIEKLKDEIVTLAVKECIEKIKSRSSSCVAMTAEGIVVAGSRTYTISEVELYKIVNELAGE